MAENDWSAKSIKIESLLLWDENARFPEEYFNKSENELIAYFLEKDEFKIRELAKEIINEFDLPQLEKIVVLNIKGQFIVLEGNRRVCVYKLLIDPSLSEDTKISKYFKELGSSKKIGKNFSLDSNVTKSKEEGLRFLERKHKKNNNEIPWGERERRNFALRRSSRTVKDVLRVDLANEVKTLELPSSVKESILGKGYVTTFYRVVDSAPARKKLNYDITEEGHTEIKNKKEFADLLKIIVYDIWNKKSLATGLPIDSRSLNKTEEIEEYLKTVDPKNISKVNKGLNAQTQKTLFGGKTLTPQMAKTRSKSLSTSRRYLIQSPIHINDNRINNIYNELRTKLLVDNVPNAVAVLFRVFLEASLDYYLDKKGINLKKDRAHDPSLHEKLQAAATDLNLVSNEMKIIHKAISSKDTIYSIDTFNAYVHNSKIHPLPSELKSAWDELGPFVERLWISVK